MKTLPDLTTPFHTIPETSMAARGPLANHLSYTALLLAGHRQKTDEVCSWYGVCYKALVPVLGKPMVMYPLSALAASRRIAKVIVLAQEPDVFKRALRGYRLDRRVTFQASRNSIGATILDVYRRLPNHPVFVTTGDNCLITHKVIDDFLVKSAAEHADISIGLVEKESLLARYPGSLRTWINFRNTSVTGCNLYLLHHERAMQAVEAWRSFEDSPKRLARLAWRLGPGFFWRYWRSNLDIEMALERLSRTMGSDIRQVFLNQYPEVAIDADKVSDIVQIERIFTNRRRERSDAPPLNRRGQAIRTVWQA